MAKLLLLLVLCAYAAADLNEQADSSTIDPTTSSSPTPKTDARTKPAPVTVTPSGVIRGSWMKSRRGRTFQAYRGIRYAQPPVGELRFQPPVDFKIYPTEVDASEDGPACPLPVAPGEYYVDEDCLRVNVYTPANNSSRKLPIIFFIHPGGFYSMTGRSDLFGPHYLLDHDIVLVTINYRLASLGFLSTGDAVAPGNNGYKDQVSALRWVQRNAAAFGGDPAQVTIAGCSAGSISVMLHMISKMSIGLFHRGIAMSASPMGKQPLPPHQLDLAQKQARILNCPTNSSRAIVDCLKTKTWQEMGNSLRGFFEQFGFDPIGLWTPVIEPDVGQPRFLTVQPDEAVRSRRIHSVPLLISQTEDEFFWEAFTVTRNKTLLDRLNKEWETIAPVAFDLPKANASADSRRLKEVYLGGKDVERTPESEKALGKLYGDAVIGFNTHRMANLMCRHSAHPVWYSEFSYVGNNSFYEDPLTGKPAGAAHHDDLIYLFSMNYFRKPIGARSPPPPAPQDAIMVDRMTAIWYSFAKNGDPNPRGPQSDACCAVAWPVMKPADRKYLRMDKEFTVREKLHEDRLQLTFWLSGHISFKLAKAWWKEPDTGVPAGARDSCSAARMWRAACSVLVCPDADEAWTRISEVAPPDTVWHSLRNCVAYQAGVWQNLLQKGVDDVMQPAAFKLAVVLRHTPTDLVVRLLAELLRLHPQSQDLTSYVLALLTDDEAAWCGACGAGSPAGAGGAGAEGAAGAPVGPAPLRDLQLFGDCELAILAASREEYEAHAKLVRAEYAALTNKNYVELRIKILNQFSQIPKLYHTPEFECFEQLARENIDREICTLREHLLTGQHE